MLGRIDNTMAKREDKKTDNGRQNTTQKKLNINKTNELKTGISSVSEE